MVHCGLCLGALRFRLQCVLLHEGGLLIMKWLLFRWGAGPLHVLRPAHLLLLLKFFPSYLQTLHLGEKKCLKCLWSWVFPSLFFRSWRDIQRVEKRYQRRHPWVGLTVAWRVSRVLLSIQAEDTQLHWTYHRLFHRAAEVWNQTVSWIYSP